MPFDYHFAFHQILGHLTTIRSAGSVIIEDHQSKLSPEVKQMVAAINQHSEQLVNEIISLKDQMYKELNENTKEPKNEKTEDSKN